MENPHFLFGLVRPNIRFSEESSQLISILGEKLNHDFSNKNLEDLACFDEYVNGILAGKHSNLSLIRKPEIVEPIIALVGEIIIKHEQGFWRTVVSKLDGTPKPFVVKRTHNNDENFIWFDIPKTASYFYDYDERDGKFSMLNLVEFLINFPHEHYPYLDYLD